MMISKRLTLLIILILGLIFHISYASPLDSLKLTEEEKLWLEEHPVIKIAHDRDFAPIEFFEDNRYQGLAVDYKDWIETHYGIEFEVVHIQTWSEILDAMRNKEIDMLAATKTPKRSEYIIFTEPFIKIENLILVRSDISDEINEKDLKYLRTAVIKDYAPQDFLEQRYPDISLIKVPNIQEGLRQLSFGNIDAFVVDEAQASYYITKLGITNLKVSSSINIDYQIQISFGFPDDHTELRSIMGKILEDISDYEKITISQKWIILKDTPFITKQTLYIIIVSLILALFVIGVILLWNRLLSREVHKKTEALHTELQGRAEAEKNLAELNEKLEAKVEHRAHLLSETNHELELSMYKLQMKQNELTEANEKLEDSLGSLKKTQNHLIESEKLAALGRLVIGVSHEINTPLGIGITSVSYMNDESAKIRDLFDEKELKRSILDEYLQSMTTSSELLLENLKNTAEMVQKFKQIAVDQSSDQIKDFELTHYLQDIVDSLRTQLRNENYTLDLSFPDSIDVKSYPSAFIQIITNLVMNSIIHGFNDRDAGNILIDISTANATVHIHYKDNGNGISPEYIEQIFEPFFTTRRGLGNIGLGLNILYNLVTQTLQGSIDVSSALGEGTDFYIEFPKILEPTNNNSTNNSQSNGLASQPEQ